MFTLRKHLQILFVTLVLSCSGPVAAGAEPAVALRFSVVIDAPQPLAAMLEQGLDLVRWQHDERMTLPLLRRLADEARRTTEQALAAEGYFSARVTTTVETGTPVATVRIRVAPGPRTVVRTVQLQFRGAVTSDSAGAGRMGNVRRNWLLAEDQPFRQENWDSAKRAALNELARPPYAAARIAASAAIIDPLQNTAGLDIEFDSGPAFRAGSTQVTGLRRYPATIVENLNPLRPGEPYDQDKLTLFQRRLLETGYFATVQMAIDPDLQQAEAAPLVVSVIESRPRRLDGGVLFSTDTGLGTQLNYSDMNLGAKAWRLRSVLQLNQKTQVMEGSVDTPPRPGGVWNTFRGKTERTDIRNQLTHQGMLEASHNWGMESSPSSIALAAHVESKKIEASAQESIHATVVAFRQTFRNTDDVLRPRRGVLGSFELGATVPGLATRQFARGRVRANLLWPLAPRLDVLTRGELGAVFSGARAGIPSSFLFRTGGDQSIRGYGFEAIGVGQGAAIVGGRYLAAAAVETTWWFAGDWGAALFIDGGDAFDERKAFDPVFGYGIGARWRSPVGPFRADLAYGERDRQLRLHFSVGFNF